MRTIRITCECGRKVECYGFRSACYCGAEYGWSGQLLPLEEESDDQKVVIESHRSGARKFKPKLFIPTEEEANGSRENC